MVPRQSAWRRPRPIGPRLEPWLAAGRTALEVNFVRCRALQCRVRPEGVIPVNVESHLSPKGGSEQRHGRKRLNPLSFRGAMLMPFQ
jgi:hypothetical protein